jgi:alkylation response protein AidB-like acyl-CoA dehydrogenase
VKPYAWKSPAGPWRGVETLRFDENEARDEALHQHLDTAGVPAQYVPADVGGGLESFDTLWRTWRAIACHDFTMATTHGATYGAASPVWIGGSRALQERTAAIIGRGGSMALGYTERRHGADLLAMETTATPVAGGYRLTGEKWLTSNARRAAAVVVFARTHPAGGPRGFSFFLVEKARVDPASWAVRPRVRTHGIRGAEIGGIAFFDCLLPHEAAVGTPGSGLEIALKSLQITRTMAAAGAIGGAETALRIALESGARLDDDVLADAFADLLVSECVALTAARALHVAPEQASITSAIAKYLVPAMLTAFVERLADALGWRACLRDGRTGLFQKLRRDLPIVSLFDGSAPVNLHAIALQLGQLTAPSVRGPTPEEAWPVLETLCRIDAPLPAFSPGRLDLTNRGRNVILDALPGVVRSGGGNISCDISSSERAVCRALDEFRTLARPFATSRGGSARSAEMFELSQAYATLHAAACGLAVWRCNRDRLGEFFARGDWLVRGIDRLLERLDPAHVSHQPPAASIAEELRRRAHACEPFSLLVLS